MSLAYLRLLDNPAPADRDLPATHPANTETSTNPGTIWQARVPVVLGNRGDQGDRARLAPAGQTHQGSPAASSPATSPATSPGVSVWHPRYARFLRRWGLVAAIEAGTFTGKMVSGHADRQVLEATVKAGSSARTVYLKQERTFGWRVRLRHWWSGHGWVTRSTREGQLLRALEAAGLPAPQWLGYGESRQGHGWLLLDGLLDAEPISGWTPALGTTRAQEAARELGQTLARIHRAGFTTPDVSWKHWFWLPHTASWTLIDWASAEAREPSALEQTQALLRLAASVPRDWSDRLKLRFLVAYRRSLGLAGRHPHLRTRAILAELARWQPPRRIRDQQRGAEVAPPIWSPLPGQSGWIAASLPDEFTPTVSTWRQLPPGTHPCPLPAAIRPSFREPALGQVDRWDSPWGWDRLWAMLREKPWQSPAARACRALSRAAQHGLNVPAVLAWGQDEAASWSPKTIASWLVTVPPVAQTDWHTAWEAATPLGRRRLLRATGAWFAQVHQAGLRIRPGLQVALQVDTAGQCLVRDARALLVVPARQMSPGIAEWADWLNRQGLRLSRAEQLAAYRGYNKLQAQSATDRDDRRWWLQALRSSKLT